MENPCKILCFGDSLTFGYVRMFKERFKQEFPDIEATVVNAGVGGETSRDGLQRLSQVLEEQPQVVLIGFGMNDQAKGITTVELANNLSKMISAFEGIGSRVLLLTLNPVGGPSEDSGNARINTYNQVIKDVAWEKRLRNVDINSSWKQEIKPWHKGLKDSCHPNELGYEVYYKVLLQVIPRSSIIILWQYNGNPCECNYACPYCTYDPKTQNGQYFKGTIDGWRHAFKNAFGNQHLVFYLAHGEPMVGERFYDVLDMIGEEPNWKVRMTSNVSVQLDRLVGTRVARERRLNVNASFHPTMTKIEDFLKKLLLLREYGVEVPVVYVMWPPLFKRFKQDFEIFNKHGFLVHVRRFQGTYRGRQYPQSYTDEERQFIARYMDDAMIKYMLSWEPSFGKLTWSGVDFVILDNEGNVGYCDDFRPGRYCLGNIFKGTLRLLPEPQPFPGQNVSDGTVDGVANFLELNYRQLDDGNNVIGFARQGGVYHTPESVCYKNMHTDFNNPRVRAEYRFPPRNLVDCFYILRCKERDLSLRGKQVAEFILPKPIFSLIKRIWRSILGRQLPTVRRVYRYLRGYERTERSRTTADSFNKTN